MSVVLTSIRDALTKVLAEAEPLPAEVRPLADCLGMALAADLIAPHDLPPFDNSGMDGYAVICADTVEATRRSPVKLALVATIPAGSSAVFILRPGQAAKIMTGAPLPSGADAVVEQEIAQETDEGVLVFAAATVGKNVRYAGGDVTAGTRVLEAGAVFGAAEIGMVASLGHPTVRVHRRPGVALVSTGSELVEVDKPLGPGQIHNSNTYALSALCQQLGIAADVLGIAADDRDITRALIAKGLEYDVLLTSGGVSVGAFDFVKEVQTELGVERLLWGVSMKPGKPLVFGRRGGTLVFGLPGNPVSAMVSFEIFVRPALLRLMGYRQTGRPVLTAKMLEDLGALKDREHAVRVRVWRDQDGWKATSTGDQGSGRMASMVGANGLVLVPAGGSGFRAGEEVDVRLVRELLEDTK